MMTPQYLLSMGKGYSPAFRLVFSLNLALWICGLAGPIWAAPDLHLTPAAQEAFSAGTNALRRGDSSAAIEAFQKVLQLDGSFAPAYLNLGLAYDTQKKYDKAIESFSRALKLDNNLGGAAFLLGIDYYQTNQTSNAIKMLQRALKLMPDRGKDIYPWLGKSLLSNGQFKLAIPYLEQAAESSPNDLTLQYQLARAHMLRSEELFEGIKRKDPQSYLVHLILADTYREQENFALAVGEYKNVLHVNPNLPGIHEALGDTYWKMRDFHAAEAEYVSELKVDPYNPGTMFKLGSLLSETDRSDEALPYLEQATRGNPPLAEAYFEIGKIWLRKGRFQDSVSNLERGMTIDSRNASAYFFLGQAYAKLGQTEKSQKAFQMSEALTKKQDEAVQENFKAFVGTYGDGKPKN
jgi:tetratricopeptide (TPR) repeat protein